MLGKRLLLLAMFLFVLSCGKTNQSNLTPEEAEDMLGFGIRLPEYLPEGMTPDPKLTVQGTKGTEEANVQIEYLSSEPLAGLRIVESSGSGNGEILSIEGSETYRIDDTNVFVSYVGDKRPSYWTASFADGELGILLYYFIAEKQNPTVAENELLRIVESMIED